MHELTLALAGDTMLGRGVAERLVADPGVELLAPELVAAAAAADLFVLNLECCISARGERFADPHKPFFFRAPPVAAERLAALGVHCVTLANNHALDYGPVALLDTVEHLTAAGVRCVGAGADARAAREPVVLERGRARLRVVAATDHPASYAATTHDPGVAYADLAGAGVPEWLRAAAAPGPDADLVLVTPHWGPNMRAAPVAHVRAAARELVGAGATLVAGHSAHVFQGASGRVLYDLGDLIDDYAVDAGLRNDRGLLWLVTLGEDGPRRIEAIPLELRYGHTLAATGAEAEAILATLRERCRTVRADIAVEDGRAVISAS